MSDDLVKRLRDAHEHSQQRILGSNIFQEAADHIEQLTRDFHEADASDRSARDLLNNLESRIEALESALTDMRAGWRYIRRHYGDLSGVGWDRCEISATAALAARSALKDTEA